MESTANKKPKKTIIDPNLLIAVGVLIASFSALFVYIRQASIMREQTAILLQQTKANAWPNLTITMFRNNLPTGLDQFGIGISNRGVGPAIITAASIQVGNTNVSSWGDFYEAIGVPDSIMTSHNNDILFDRIIQARENFEFIDWSFNKPLMNFVFEKSDVISILICYESVYGDQWQVRRIGFKTNLEKNTLEKITECSISDEIEFEE